MKKEVARVGGRQLARKMTLRSRAAFCIFHSKDLQLIEFGSQSVGTIALQYGSDKVHLPQISRTTSSFLRITSHHGGKGGTVRVVAAARVAAATSAAAAKVCGVWSMECAHAVT